MNNQEKHYINRSGWLRAGVLGANDGILSTASIIIGVAAASSTRDPVIIAGIAGLVAGALSMAAGEYVSVSSQTDIEKSDLEREQQELLDTPEEELIELAKIYEKRGLQKATALEVAKQLTAHNALEAHARDELGIMEITEAKPLQAALSSGVAFTLGGFLPVAVAFLAPLAYLEYLEYVFAIIFLAVLGIVSARAGGSRKLKAVLRITFWGTLAMGTTALIGYLFNINMV
ncbi:MAG TPA: VIT family protein [Flavobacteriaceae bacterium]|jgi:VIT1/CCC1 family predicted Fe2+/Mn2+ transporter|nr:VIT family protein [Flavobacteriaceae bacterium]HIN97844.1 VIT family protein [Flavobacteriaceae bacterium]|tara:strand:- start:87943 stop:88635 length:693 start_codon:yes stop_codon:yes gene_type:complete